MCRKFNSSFITDIEIMKYVGLLIFVLLIQIFTAYSVELAQDDGSSELNDSDSHEIPILIGQDIGNEYIQKESEPHQNDDDGGKPKENSGKDSKHVNGKPYDGISDAHNVLTGSLSNIVGNVLASLSSLHTALSELTDCVSTNISSVSKTLFKIVDPLTDISGSTFDIITSLSDALPIAFSSIIILFSDLNLGDVSASIHTAIDDLQESLTEIINIVDEDGKLKNDITEKVDETIKSAATSVQILVNTISFVTETASQTIGFIEIDVQDAVASLTLVLDTLLIIVQIITASITYVLSSSQQTISSTLNKFLLTMDGGIQGISGIVTAVASNLLVDLSSISETLTTLTTNLNTSLIDVLGVFKGLTISIEQLTETLTSTVSSTAADITYGLESLLNGLTDALGNIGTSITASVQSIKSSLDIVSLSDTGALSSVTGQLISIFDILSKLTGSAEIIVPEIINSLKIIFENINSPSTTTSLVSGLGVEIATSVVKAVIEISGSINHLLTLINGVSKLDYNGMEGHVKDIAKNAQILISTVAAITASVSQSIDELVTITFEVVLALQYILATILFILQWVLTLTASVSFQSTSGKVSEALSSITVSVSGALHNISKITATISGALPENSSSIVSLIAVAVSEFGSIVTSTFSKVSGIVYNVTANIRQIKSSNIKGADGSVAQILEGLNGGLGSVSSTLSSSISDLTSSFKQIKNSTYVTIKSATDKLTLVIETVTGITDSSSEILSSVSDSLSGIYSQILDSVSILTVLGEVRGSVTSSVSDIAETIYSLRNVINVDSENLNDVSQIVGETTKNIAKTIQILISTFSAVVNALVNSSKTIDNPLSEAVLTLSYVVSTVILVVQEVLGAAIVSMSVIFGKISVLLQQLTASNSIILEKVTSISSSITSSLTGTIESLTIIIRNISSSVTDLNTLCTSSLSVISGVTVNMNVSLAQMASESVTLPKLPSVDVPSNEKTVEIPAIQTSDESETVIEPVEEESVAKTFSKVPNDQVSEASSRKHKPKEVRAEL